MYPRIKPAAADTTPPIPPTTGQLTILNTQFNGLKIVKSLYFKSVNA